MLTTFFDVPEEDVKTAKSFSQHRITTDLEVIKTAQQAKEKEKDARIAYRRKLAELFFKILPASGSLSVSKSYSISTSFFEADGQQFIREVPPSSELHILCTHPLIAIYDHFLTDSECDWALENLEHENAHLERGGFMHDKKDVSDKHRISEFVGFSRDSDFSTFMRKRLIDKLFPRCHPDYVQHSMIQRYKEGGFVSEHADYRSHEEGYQRRFTTLAYLNTCSSGGETEFPYVGLQIQPVRGRVLVWQNATCAENLSYNMADPLSKHQGNVVPQGLTKYIVTTFLLNTSVIFDNDITVAGLPLPSSMASPRKHNKRKLDDVGNTGGDSGATTRDDEEVVAPDAKKAKSDTN